MLADSMGSLEGVKILGYLAGSDVSGGSLVYCAMTMFKMAATKSRPFRFSSAQAA